MQAALGSAEAQLRAAATAVLAAGSKSCSHCWAQLERNGLLLAQLAEGVGVRAGQAVLLEVLGSMYGQMPTRLHLALTR
jgi:hypothetical protein